MRDPRFARRRRAAVPAALAAFMLLVVVSGARSPLTWAGGSPFTPAMTIVLPAQEGALAPADAAREQPAGDAAPLEEVATGTGGDAGAGATGDGGADAGGGSDDGEDEAGNDDDTTGPAVRHVFVVMLHETDLVALADGDAAPYFAGRLVPQGTLLTRYAAVARGSLANGIALLSGQGPTAQTLADCPTAAGAAPADVTPDVLGDDGQQLGDGCVYPVATGTMPDQLLGAGLDWRAYVEGAGGACPATPRDPFAYFHSLRDADGCARRVGGLDVLDADLARGADAPALLYVVPDACHDGGAAPCAPGAPAGAAAADAFLERVVPQILASAAYADGGLLAITSDGPPPPAPATPPPATTPAPSPAPPTPTPTTTTPAPPTPTTPTPTTTTPVPPTAPGARSTTAPTPGARSAATAAGEAAGGPLPAAYPNVGDAAAAGAGRVGALLVSPSVPAGRRSAAPAGHFTLLRAISDLFALQPLGYAGGPELVPLPDRVLAPNAN